MRTLAIGDVHGCLVALRTLLRLVAPVDGDTIVALGDYVDRGPDSRGVLDCVIELYDANLLVPLCGNHDEMMIEAGKGNERSTWLSCGGRETLASYGHQTYDRRYDRIPARHWQFLEDECCDYFETDTHLFVHACIYPDVPLKDQDNWVMRWQKLRGPIRHRSGKTLICGHTKQYDGVPLVYDTTVCIDTGAYDSVGWLTCLDVESGRYWQANQRGQTRQGHLDEHR